MDQLEEDLGDGAAPGGEEGREVGDEGRCSGPISKSYRRYEQSQLLVSVCVQDLLTVLLQFSSRRERERERERQVKLLIQT